MFPSSVHAAGLPGGVLVLVEVRGDVAIYATRPISLSGPVAPAPAAAPKAK